MNILEVEDQIKGLPDQMLFQEAQQPSGRMPQFLVVSEIQRRAKMRQAAQKPPTETVGEKVVQEGIASLMPQPQTPPQGIAQAPQFAQGAPQQRTSPAQPMMMASGGVTKMADGGMSPFGSGFTEEQGIGNIIDYLYNQQMQQAQAQREAAQQARATAEERGSALQEQARRDAFNQALVGIGTGIARGDMAGGFAAGSESAQARMKEARDAALRASERGEQLALSREEAARQAELGAGSQGAQVRLTQLTQKDADLPASLQEFSLASRIVENPDQYSESQRAWATRTLEGDRPATQENFEYFLDILNDPERSEVEKEAARLKLAGSGFSFEQTADGTIRLSQGPQGLTTGTTTQLQGKDVAFDIAERALTDLEPLVAGASPAAFGLIGQKMEAGAGLAEQLSALPGVGGAFASVADYLSDEDRTKMRVAAEQARGQLLPIITGEPSKFTEGDVERADKAIRILSAAGSKTQALIAVANLRELMGRAREVLQERLGTELSATSAAPAGTAPPVTDELARLEELARKSGLDPDQIYQQRGLPR